MEEERPSLSHRLTHLCTHTSIHPIQTSGLEGDRVLAANDLMLVPVPARKEGATEPSTTTAAAAVANKASHSGIRSR